jgi:hypothetical protein
LGNQLFMLAAGWEQAVRLGCPLYLDGSAFEVNKNFAYGLDVLDVPAEHLAPAQSPWRTVRVPGGRHWPLPRRTPGRIYLERSVAHFCPKIFQVRPGTTLVGYFQSPRYFPGIRRSLIDSLWRAPESSVETELIASFRARPAITLHLRRGDYLSGASQKVFLATAAYARRAIDTMRRAGYQQQVRVFTDSTDLVREELHGTDGVEFVDNDVPLGAAATLKAMAVGIAMIMSNSTFSWWAATLMRSRPEAEDCLVIAPRPWTASGESRADLLEPDWITLDAR